MRGGQEHSLLQVCKGLSSRKHELTLLYDEPGDLLELYAKSGINLIQVKGSASSGSFSFDRKSPVKSGLAFMNFLRRGTGVKPEVVYINQPFDALFPGLLANLVRRRLVCHLRLPPGDLCKQWVVGLRKVSTFIAISEQTRREYLAAGFPEKQISLVHNAVDSSIFRLVEPKKELREQYGVAGDGFVVGYAGRIDREKGLETLLAAFAKSALSQTGGKLLIAGSPVCPRDADEPLSEYVDELKALSVQLEIEKNVHWLGHLSDLPSFYSTCDTTVLPTSEFSEPFGRVLIESMSCETPVIGSRIGGIPEILTGEFSRFLFEPRNVDQLAELLLEMKSLRMSDPELGVRSREFVMSKFPLEGMIDGIESILAASSNLSH
jgi:glycosyltransferase involved in cell wall biosynthesis